MRSLRCSFVRALTPLRLQDHPKVILIAEHVDITTTPASTTPLPELEALPSTTTPRTSPPIEPLSTFVDADTPLEPAAETFAPSPTADAAPTSPKGSPPPSTTTPLEVPPPDVVSTSPPASPPQILEPESEPAAEQAGETPPILAEALDGPKKAAEPVFAEGVALVDEKVESSAVLVGEDAEQGIVVTPAVSTLVEGARVDPTHLVHEEEEDASSSSDDDDDDIVVSALLSSRNSPMVLEEPLAIEVDPESSFPPFAGTPLAYESAQEEEQEPPSAQVEQDSDSESEDELNLLLVPASARESAAISKALSPRRTSSRLRSVEPSSPAQRLTRPAPPIDASPEAAPVALPDTLAAPPSVTRRSSRRSIVDVEDSSPPKSTSAKRARQSEIAPASPSISATKRRKAQDAPEAETETEERPTPRRHDHSHSAGRALLPTPSASTSASTYLPVTRSHCAMHVLSFPSKIHSIAYRVAIPGVRWIHSRPLCSR